MILQADSLRIPLPTDSINAVITSPPYYRQRVYPGLEPTLFPDGWYGYLGNEPSPEMYANHLVQIGRELRRVLRPDGVLWMVIGDKYAGSGGAGGDYATNGMRRGQPKYGRLGTPSDLKPKDLIGVPSLVAKSFRGDGWWWRAEVIWAKGRDGQTTNFGPSYPGSAMDRPHSTHEKILLLTPSKQYSYDYIGSRVQHEGGSHALRSVWIINTKNSGKGKHFAAYPESLVDLILTTVPKHICGTCGTPLERVIVKGKKPPPTKEAQKQQERCDGVITGGTEYVTLGVFHGYWDNYATTIGWEWPCGCSYLDVTRPLILDPFVGSGTTIVSALNAKMGGVGLELSLPYAKFANKEILNYITQLQDQDK